MNHLLPILKTAVGQTEINTVNARELHEFLEVGTDFSTWIKSRIADYDFRENQDYVLFRHSPKTGSGNRGAKIDYHLSLDMAKELSMVERNEKGRQAGSTSLSVKRNSVSPKNPLKVLALSWL